MKNIDESKLSNFQRDIWKILLSLLKNLNGKIISEKSSLEIGLGIDVFLKLRDNDFILYISVTDDLLYINSKYFDIYIYPEMNLKKIKLVMTEVFMGNYKINLEFNNKNKLIQKKLIFYSKNLQEFNENNRRLVLKKNVESIQSIKGIKLIRS